jgi:hypothetical protein
VAVAGAGGGGEALVKDGDGLFGAVLFGKGLGGHLVRGDVVGVEFDEAGKLGEGGVGVGLRQVLHGETVTGEGVGGVKGEDFREGGEFVHEGIVAQSDLTAQSLREAEAR